MTITNADYWKHDVIQYLHNIYSVFIHYGVWVATGYTAQKYKLLVR